jgi:hypothetical protein
MHSLKGTVQRGLVSLSLIFFTMACTSPSKAPGLDPDDLMTLKFNAINPRNIHLVVQNQRKVNHDAGNWKEAEKAVYTAVSGALVRGGFTVKDSSKNRLLILVMDYDGPKQPGECVKINGNLHAKWGSEVAAEAFACQQYRHITGISLGGDVSEAYRMALNTVFDQLEKEQMQLAGY